MDLYEKKSISTGLNQLGLSEFKCTKEFSFIASSINASKKCIGWQNLTKSALWLRSCHTPWTLFTSTVESHTVQIYTFAAHEKYMFYMNFTCDIKKIKLEVHS